MKSIRFNESYHTKPAAFNASEHMRFGHETVSIIIPTYNRPVSVLSRAVQDALDQTYSDIEVLVVNDCPENEDLSIAIESMVDALDDSRITCIHMDRNRGACAARNTGAFAARGSFLSFLDDDDRWETEKIEKQLAAFSDGVGLVTSSFQSSSGTIVARWKQLLSGNQLEASLKANVIGPTSVPLIRAEVFKNVGGFDERITFGQEFDLWIRIARCSDIAFVDEPLVIYNLSDDSTFRNSKEKFRESTYIILKKYSTLYNDHPKALSYYLNSAALTSLSRFHDFMLYIEFKRLATRSTGLTRYSLMGVKKAALRLFQGSGLN